MTVKEYLRQYEEAERIARRMKSEYDAALLKIDAIKSPMDTDGTPHGSGITRRTEEAAIQLAEAAERYKDAEIVAIKKRSQVFNLIWNVPGIKGDILYERYINLKRWDEIADIVHVSFRHATRLHGEALNELKDVLVCPEMSCYYGIMKK
jgi:DNA-directed RNA polymerase specialized sigma subunit